VATDIPRRRPRRSIRITFAAIAASCMVFGFWTAAYAQPDPAAVEAQIDQAWNTLEPTIEQYNKVHGELQANKAKAAALQEQIRPLQLQVDLAMSRVSNVAVNVYKTGPGSDLNALLATGSPTTLVDQLTMLNMVARDQHARISDVEAARNRYIADKKVLDDLIKQQAAQDADLGAKKTQIEAQLADLQKLRQQVGGTTAATNFKPVACPVDYLPGPGGTAAKKACSLIGKPYIWAAAGPDGYDCSGLMLTAWAAAGVSLRHYTNWQWSDTKAVSRADLRPGDLVFFFKDLHHMGMYVGQGWMVHAPQTGDHVRMAKIDSPSLPIAGYRRPGK
jgi:cell wall-associated NlpC family hydrolase